MGLIDSKSKKLDFFLRRIKTEMAYKNLTVHDEIDYIADFSILKAFTKKMSQVLDVSKSYKKYNVPFIRYLYDVEYDDYGSWTAGRAIDVYSLPINRDEKIAIDAYNEAVAILKGSISEAEEKTDIVKSIKVNYIGVELSTEEFIAKLERLPQGETTLRVKVDEKKKALKFYKKLEQSALLSLIDEIGLEIIT